MKFNLARVYDNTCSFKNLIANSKNTDLFLKRGLSKLTAHLNEF